MHRTVHNKGLSAPHTSSAEAEKPGSGTLLPQDICTHYPHCLESCLPWLLTPTTALHAPPHLHQDVTQDSGAPACLLHATTGAWSSPDPQRTLSESCKGSGGQHGTAAQGTLSLLRQLWGWREFSAFTKTLPLSWGPQGTMTTGLTQGTWRRVQPTGLGLLLVSPGRVWKQGDISHPT